MNQEQLPAPLPDSLIPILALCFLLSVGLPAQSTKTNQKGELTISLKVEQVLLNMSVRDHKGRAVAGLSEKNFQIYEDGRPQEISHFLNEDIPVTVGLVIDASRSMRPRQPELVTAASVFTRTSNPRDELFVVRFNENVHLGLPGPMLSPGDQLALRQAMTRIVSDGQTALYDAIDFAMDHLEEGKWDKHVLVVVSDGGDNASQTPLERLLSRVGRSEVIIYAIGLSDEFNEDRNPRVLKKLARATGGRAFFPSRLRDVAGICERIATDIRTQYSVAYTPTNERRDGAYRRIRVVARSATGKKLSVTTRAGYYAPNRQVKEDLAR